MDLYLNINSINVQLIEKFINNQFSNIFLLSDWKEVEENIVNLLQSKCKILTILNDYSNATDMMKEIQETANNIKKLEQDCRSICNAVSNLKETFKKTEYVEL